MFSSWIVSQLGGREHYAIARGLSRRHLLETLVTDFWRPEWLRPATVSRVPFKPLHRWAGRFADGVEGKVLAFNLEAGLKRTWHYGRRGRERVFAAHAEHGRWFASKTARVIAASPFATVFFGYSAASLESLAAAKRKGLFAIVDQIDPALEHWKLVEAEWQRFPYWEERPPEVPAAFWDRLRDEWNTADMIVVNSEWSRESLVKQGAPDEKLSVLPLAYEPGARPAAGRRTSTPTKGRLKVLWLATVSLAKGIPYLLEAAKQLPGVQFDVAGPLRISQRVVKDAPANVTFHGQVPRIRTAAFYEAADLFLLPTISDGFAMTQLEAMSFGVPVIATPNCGKVVTDGHNGFIVPVRNATAIANRIAQLDQDRENLAELSEHARATLGEFTLDKVIDRLLLEVARRIGSQTGARVHRTH